MGIAEDIRTVTWVRSHSAELLEQVNRTRSPVVILRRSKPLAVVEDFASYESKRKALAMLRLLSQGEEDVAAGRVIPQDEVFRQLRARLQQRRRKCKSQEHR